MKKEEKNGVLNIICDNLGEFFREFKKFRDAKKFNNLTQLENFREYVDHCLGFWGITMNTGKTATGKDYVKDEIISVSISLREPPLDDEKIDLVLKLPNLSEAEFENYSPEIEKVLEEIWTTGALKNTRGLDLYWPAKRQLFVWCDQCHKYIEDRKLTYFSDIEKNLDFCSENCYSKFKKNKEENQQLKAQLKKETSHKNIWMVISISLVVIFSFTLLVGWRKIKKLKKH